jgi:hypothetical protein
MEDNNVNEVTPGEPVKKPLFWLTISRITRIGSAVLLIIGGNIDLIMGLVLWVLVGMADPANLDYEVKQNMVQRGGNILLGGILLFGVNLAIGIFSILKKQWAIWFGLVLSSTHCIGMYILLRLFGSEDVLSEVFLIAFRGWAIAIFLFASTILIGQYAKDYRKSFDNFGEIND